jgi:hypothetical protein
MSLFDEQLTEVISVGDTEGGPKSDILGQASLGIQADHCLDFPV